MFKRVQLQLFVVLRPVSLSIDEILGLVVPCVMIDHPFQFPIFAVVSIVAKCIRVRVILNKAWGLGCMVEGIVAYIIFGQIYDRDYRMNV